MCDSMITAHTERLGDHEAILSQFIMGEEGGNQE